ncbi:ABC transporter ATP-binding protein [Microbacterium sp. A8/3-1]|uniref:ABC transporter ATP-binding protein n=1 Tax=Microbacterium sp. A8/3-1 TaxID=3160749 RepID=A0AAU7W2D5_9MICO
MALFAAANLLAISLPIASALAAGWLVGAVTRERPAALLAPVVAFGALVVARQLLEPFQDVARLCVARNIDSNVRSSLRRISLGIADRRDAETPQLLEDIGRASDQNQSGSTRTPGSASVGQAMLTFRVIGGAGAAIVVAGFFPLLGIGLFAVSLVIRVIVRRQWMWLSSLDDSSGPGLARTRYLADLITSTAAAKETRVFALGDWLRTRWHDIAWRREERMAATKSVVLNRQGLTILLGAGSAFAFYVTPGLAVVSGTLSTQDLVRVVVAAFAVSELSAMGFEAWDIDYGRDAVSALRRVESRPLASTAPHPTPPRGGAGVPISLENVSFAFDLSRPVLRGVDLYIAPNEIVGLVGRNGAGKSTLVKVLTGLYPTDAGQIVVDGMSRDQNADWLQQFAVVQQGFVHYPGSVRSNVRLGAPELSDTDDEGVWMALERAGLRTEIERLPDGLDTSLWSQRGGSEDLSGGQWQRLALARALFSLAHGRRVLILDEPTSQLDAPSEARFFQDVISAVRDRTVILISHRLSTIRHADRIHFLADGVVRESGTHDELVSREGEYSRLFALQASRFGNDAVGGQ